YVELDYDAASRVVAVREWIRGCKEPLVREPHYDAKGRIQYSEYDDPSEGRWGRNSYEYDNQDRICARQEVNRNGELVFRTLSKCDEEGLFLEETGLDKKLRLVERHVYEYDERGLRTLDTVFGGKGGPEKTGFYTMTYDDRGRMTRRAWHDKDDNEQSAFAYTYDAHNLLTTMAIERDGKVCTTVRNTYGVKGSLIATDYLDDAGKQLVLERPAATKPAERRTSLRRPNPEMVPQDEPATPRPVTDRWIHAALTVGYHHYENARYEKAQELFESVAAYRPDNAYALSGVAACALARGKLQTALNWYDRALATDPTHPPSIKGRNHVLTQLQRQAN
ncbi:tetratricopeptide repeat protein, partial [Myxococcota bacterium]